MKILKKSVSVFLCVLLAFSSLLALYSYAADGVYYDFEDGFLTVTGRGAMDRLFTGDASIVDVYICKGVTSVPAEAFKGCANLTTVTISNSVTEIGASAFENCSSLDSLRLSNTIETINENTFKGCSALVNVKLPDSVKTVKSGAFADCASLDYAIITLGTKEIEAGAFDNCASLSTVYYAGTEAMWESVTAPEGCLGSAELVSAAPVVDFTVTRSAGKAVVSAVQVSGNLRSADMVFNVDGNISMGGVKTLRYLTTAFNRETGAMSIAAVDNLAPNVQIAQVTFKTGSCDEFSISVDFLTCYVEIESYTIETSVKITGDNPVSRHTIDSWTVSQYPTVEADGTATGICEQCGEVTKALPCAFKDCTVNEKVVKFSDYALTPSEFKESHIIPEAPEAVPSLGELVGTGSTVSVDYDVLSIDYSLALTGDSDGDAYCDAQDSVIMMCITMGLLTEESLSKCTKAACDCNDDSSIDETDAAFAFNHGIGL